MSLIVAKGFTPWFSEEMFHVVKLATIIAIEFMISYNNY